MMAAGYKMRGRATWGSEGQKEAPFPSHPAFAVQATSNKSSSQRGEAARQKETKGGARARSESGSLILASVRKRRLRNGTSLLLFLLALSSTYLHWLLFFPIFLHRPPIAAHIAKRIVRIPLRKRTIATKSACHLGFDGKLACSLCQSTTLTRFFSICTFPAFTPSREDTCHCTISAASQQDDKSQEL